MKIKSIVVTGLIASLVLFVGVAFAQQSESQQSDPAMQQSQSESQQQAAMSSDPQTVKQVQQALSSQGYDPGPADGKLGSKTQSALKEFQESQGMQATGQIDQQTLASLGIEGAAAGGQEGSMPPPDEQSGAGGQQESMPPAESQQDSMSDQQSGAGGQQEGNKY